MTVRQDRTMEVSEALALAADVLVGVENGDRAPYREGYECEADGTTFSLITSPLGGLNLTVSQSAFDLTFTASDQALHELACIIVRKLGERQACVAAERLRRARA